MNREVLRIVGMGISVALGSFMIYLMGIGFGEFLEQLPEIVVPN